MSARIALPTLVLAVVAALASAPPTVAGPWGLPSGDWYANLEGSTFTSDTFHGEGFRSDTGLIVQERALRTVVEVGWKKRMTLVFGLPVLSVTRRDARVQGTATGFQDVSVGMRYNLLDGESAIAVELDWSAPAGYNRNLDTLGLALGDGRQELNLQITGGTGFAPGGFFQWSLGHSYRYLGFGKQSDELVVTDPGHPAKYLWSRHVTASADLGLWVGPSFLIGGRYRGKVAISSGLLVEESDTHLAGPLLLYRFDDRMDMFAGSWSTAAGRNTLHFDQVYVGFAFRHTKLNRLQGFLGGKQAS
ncbi:MAG: hypothetical protein ACRENJ_03830 [Candidatus Eiseniibacteriota bacterium]